MTETGFIVIWREMIRSWVHCLNDADFRLAVTCICMANWKPGKWFDGVETIEIERGSFVTTVSKLTGEMGKDSSAKKVRNGLRRLSNAEFLKSGNTSGKRYTHITIMNYSQYQDMKEMTGNTSGNDRAMTGQTVGNDRATIEQGNKGTRITREPSSRPPADVTPEMLESAYKLYPLKKGKATGLSKAKKTIKTKADYDQFRLCIVHMSHSFAADSTYCPHFSTFVNGRLWEDDEWPSPRKAPDAPRRRRGLSPADIAKLAQEARDEDR